MFKRIEVWVLIIVAGAASIWFAFFQPTAEDATLPKLPEVVIEKSAIELVSSQVEASDDHFVISLKIATINEGNAPILLDPPFASLTTADGIEIEPFFLPFAPAPVLHTGPDSVAELHYWLPADASCELSLKLGEQTLPLQFNPTGITVRP